MRTIQVSRMMCGVLMCGVILLAGCTHFYASGGEHRQNASVVDFLFPEGKAEAVEPSVPVLDLPLDVGVAFVPAGEVNRRYRGRDLSEERKAQLLKAVAREFEGYKFVRRIEIVPTSYLREGGSFKNLDQVAKLFGVQVIALVSYDQMQFSDRDAVSLAYWTVVGAYFVEGEKNDTQTLLDAVVYDVASRKLLFRAPGVSRIEARSTPVNLSDELRQDAETGFEQAATNLVTNLKGELANFQARVKDRPDDVKFVARPGYTGAGGFGIGDGLIMMLLAMAGWAAARRGRRTAREHSGFAR